jgi:uncharacterized protein (TIGR03437 family)
MGARTLVNNTTKLTGQAYMNADLFSGVAASTDNNNSSWATLETTPYLWAVAASSASNYCCNGVVCDLAAHTTGTQSSTPYNIGNLQLATVFTQLNGSGMDGWMTSGANPGHILPSVLGGSHALTAMYGNPYVYRHPMALGETIGYGMQLTMNNRASANEYQAAMDGSTPNWLTPGVHISLLGDPTLRVFPVSPPSSVSAFPGAGTVALTWTASTDTVAGYNVYRAGDPSGPFARVNSSLILGNGFVDQGVPLGTFTYMVRAIKLQITGAGSYFNPSQGAFSSPATVNSGGTGRPPSVNTGGVVNGATFGAGQPISPGSIVSVFGSDLAVGTATAGSIPLPTSLSDVVSVTFNGVPAPLFYVSPGQINAQAPWELAGAASVNVVVNRSTGSSVPVSAPAAMFSPGIFTMRQTGQGQGVAVIYPDNSFAAPAGSIPGAASRPAAHSDILTVWGTGLGPVEPPVATGHNALDALRTTVTPPLVLIGGVSAPVSYSGLSPQFVGIYQVNCEVPAGAPSGDAVPLQIVIGGTTTSDKVEIAIANK